MNKFNKKSMDAYNKKADDYDNTTDGRFTEAFKQLLVEQIHVRANDSVLDVACGNGTLLARINEKETIKGFGIDISSQMVKNATTRYPMFSFVTGGCEKIPFGDNSMDTITVCAAYHHFPNVNDFASEAKRLLKPNGNLYIAEIYLPAIIRMIANPFVPLSTEGDVKFYSTKEISKTFSSMGFKLVTRRKRGHIQILHFNK
jgi:ubiquinone/menaquinone biosynthesis C-methylase UbiE